MQSPISVPVNVPQDWSDSIWLLPATVKWRRSTYIAAYPSEWLLRLQGPALSFGASTNVTADAARRNAVCNSGLELDQWRAINEVKFFFYSLMAHLDTLDSGCDNIAPLKTGKRWNGKFANTWGGNWLWPNVKADVRQGRSEARNSCSRIPDWDLNSELECLQVDGKVSSLICFIGILYAKECRKITSNYRFN